MMKKRLCSLVLVFAMLLSGFAGAVPAFAAEAGTVLAAAYAAADQLTPDGVLTESAWLIDTPIGDAGRIGALWNAENLYLGIASNENTVELTVAGKSLACSMTDGTLTGNLAEAASVSVSSGAAELTIPMSAIETVISDYGQAIALSVSAGEGRFDGSIVVNSNSRFISNDSEKASSLFTSWGHVPSGTYTWAGTEYEDGVLRMYDTYQEGCTPSLRTYAISGNIAALAAADQDILLEFDFCAASMPVYPAPSYISAATAYYGFWGILTGNLSGTAPAVCFGISNTSNGLVFTVNGGSAAKHAYVYLNKQVGDSFRVGLKKGADGNITLYVDGEEVRVFSGAVNNIAGYGNKQLMLNITRNATAATSAADNFDLTVSNLSISTAGPESLIDSLTFDHIRNNNISASSVTSDLNLISSLTDTRIISPSELVWTSSNPDVISTEGVVTRPDTTAVTVTLTAALQNNPSKTKTFLLTVPALTFNAYLAEQTVTTDGALTENEWNLDCAFGIRSSSEAPSGQMGMLWSNNDLYAAISYSNATELTISLGTATLTADLETGAFVGESYGAEISVANGIAELKLPMDALGCQPADYEVRVAFNAVLTGAGGTASVASSLSNLILTGDYSLFGETAGTADQRTWTLLASSGCSASLDTAGVHLKHNSTTTDDYTVARTPLISNFTHDRDYLLEQTICINDLPEYDSSYFFSSTSSYGFFMIVAASSYTGTTTTNRDSILLAFFNNAGKLSIALNTGTAWDAVSLNKNLGTSFRLGLGWNEDNTLEVYVDGSLIHTYSNATVQRAQSNGSSAVLYRTRRGASDTSAMDIVISDVSLTSHGYDTLLDSLSLESILGENISASNVTKDLVLPSQVVTPCLTGNLVWTCSDPDVIGTDGTLTPPTDGFGRYITVTAAIDDEALGRSVSFQFYVPVISSVPTTEIPVYYTSAAPTIDGTPKEASWYIGTKLAKENDDAPDASVGLLVDADYLYVALITGDGNSISLDFNGKKLVSTTSLTISENDFVGTSAAIRYANSYMEIRLPLSAAGLTLEKLGGSFPFTVSVSNDSGSSSVAANCQAIITKAWSVLGDTAELQSLKGYSISAAASNRYTGDSISTSGKAVQAPAGSYLFYDDGTAPSGRNYFLLNGSVLNMSPENYTSIEMDILVESMMPLDTDHFVSVNATYGFWFSIAGPRTDVLNGAAASKSILCGIVSDEEDQLYLIINGGNTSEQSAHALGKCEGEAFHLTVAWQPDQTVTAYVDGSLLVHRDASATGIRNAIGTNAFMMNTQRDPFTGDPIEIYVDNIQILNHVYDDEFLLEATVAPLTFDMIRGENTSQDAITSNLELPDSLAVVQPAGFDGAGNASVTWSSSAPDIIGIDGTVNRPESCGAIVTLTAVISYSDLEPEVRNFQLYVKATNPQNTVQAVFNDLNPATGQGEALDIAFTLDTGYNSIIFDRGSTGPVDTVALYNANGIVRLHTGTLTLWYSNDGANYEKIDNFKLYQDGNTVYLYDFQVDAQYIKVHSTYLEDGEASFHNILQNMIVAYDAPGLFGVDETGFSGSATVTIRNNTGAAAIDAVWAVTLDDLGLTKNDLRADMGDIRFINNNEQLYHYWNGESFVVRIPELAAGKSATLQVSYGSETAMNISNGSGVYEVEYGTRTVFDLTDDKMQGGNMPVLVQMPNGNLVVFGSASRDYLTMRVSTDGGRTWGASKKVECDGFQATAGGGVIVDNETGRVFYQGYGLGSFVASDVTQSDLSTYIMYTDDSGETWHNLGELQTDATYILSYSDGIKLSGADGAGPNVDYVFPLGSQYNNLGSFCCRVAYSDDGGNTWQTGPSKIIYGDAAAFEGGVSECTILEREDGVLVLIGRCQFDGVDNFALSYSYDCGLTWQEHAELSDIYTVNTQPILYEYRETPLLVWGGNNVLGGDSYARYPLNLAYSADGMETFIGIQDLYSKYSLAGLGMGNNVVVNPSIKAYNNGRSNHMLIGWSNNWKENYVMLIEDFDDYFTKTKGAFDSFESRYLKYEGWLIDSGNAEITDTVASEGAASMAVSEKTLVSRSIPYFTSGTISMDIHSDSLAGGLDIDLQAAFTNVTGKATVGGLYVDANGAVFVRENGGSALSTNLALTNGWNRLVITADLAAGHMTVSLNGQTADIPVNSNVGTYICFVNLFTGQGTRINLDRFFVEDTDAQTQFNDEQAEKFDLYGANMKLGNDLSMNFFVSMADVTGEGWYAEISRGDDVLTIDLADCETSGGYYKITYPGFAAKEMTDEVVVTIYDADGNAVSNPWRDSIRTYAMRILVNKAATDADKTLMVDMLNYGAAAQNQFTYKTNDLANALLNDEQKAYATESVELTNKLEAGKNYYGTSLNLKTNIQMNVYFTNVTEDMTAFITYTNHNGETKNFEVPVVMSGSYGKVTVESMVVADAYQMLTIKVKDTDGNVVASVIDSVESYCQRTMGDQPLNEYLMKFAQSAWKSFHS